MYPQLNKYRKKLLRLKNLDGHNSEPDCMKYINDLLSNNVYDY